MNEGVKFDEVARNYSEDKARQGKAQISLVGAGWLLTMSSRWIVGMEG